jgi:hypothetical protein
MTSYYCQACGDRDIAIGELIHKECQEAIYAGFRDRKDCHRYLIKLKNLGVKLNYDEFKRDIILKKLEEAEENKKIREELNLAGMSAREYTYLMEIYPVNVVTGIVRSRYRLKLGMIKLPPPKNWSSVFKFGKDIDVPEWQFRFGSNVARQLNQH